MQVDELRREDSRLVCLVRDEAVEGTSDRVGARRRHRSTATTLPPSAYCGFFSFLLAVLWILSQMWVLLKKKICLFQPRSVKVAPERNSGRKSGF